MIGMPGPAAALGLGAAADRARGKLLAAVGERGGMAADRIAGRFHLDPVDWYRAPEPVMHLPAIARAVIDQKQLAMTYESWKGERERVVEPIGLVQKGSSWYLVGRVGRDMRTYRIAAIKALATRDESFERPKAFDLAEHWAAQIDRFEQDLRQEKAIVRANRFGRKLIAELGAYGERAVAEAHAEDSDGWAELVFPYENIEQAVRALLGLGDAVEVIDPPTLRQAMIDTAKAIIARAQKAL